jgi:hypothetical protein
VSLEGIVVSSTGAFLMVVLRGLLVLMMLLFVMAAAWPNSVLVDPGSHAVQTVFSFFLVVNCGR